MTATRLTRITCQDTGPDGICGHNRWFQALSPDASQALARAEGWTREDDRDICPSHSMARERQAIRS